MGTSKGQVAFYSKMKGVLGQEPVNTGEVAGPAGPTKEPANAAGTLNVVLRKHVAEVGAHSRFVSCLPNLEIDESRF